MILNSVFGNFSVKGQRVKEFEFTYHTVFVATTQHCQYNSRNASTLMKATIEYLLRRSVAMFR